MIVPDVNLLLYAYRREMPDHETAWQWWTDLLDGDEQVGIPWSVVIAFLRLMTNRHAMVLAITIDEAIQCVADWFRHSHVEPISPVDDHMSNIAALLRSVQTGGNIVPDAHIAALALEYNAEVHSNDSDFGRFSGVRWHNPLRWPAALKARATIDGVVHTIRVPIGWPSAHRTNAPATRPSMMCADFVPSSDSMHASIFGIMPPPATPLLIRSKA